MAVDKPSQPAKPAIARHQASAPTNTSSGRRATDRKHRRQHKPAGQKCHRQEENHIAESVRQRTNGGIFQVRLESEKQNDEQILQHQNAQRDPPDE